jgi:hypothetical protein
MTVPEPIFDLVEMVTGIVELPQIPKTVEPIRRNAKRQPDNSQCNGNISAFL